MQFTNRIYLTCLSLTIDTWVFYMYFILCPTFYFHKLSIWSFEVFSSYNFHRIALVKKKVNISHQWCSMGWVMLDSTRWSSLSGSSWLLPHSCRWGCRRWSVGAWDLKRRRARSCLAYTCPTLDTFISKSFQIK